MLDNYNLTMLMISTTEITIFAGYFHSDVHDYEALLRWWPREFLIRGGCAIMAGLEQVISICISEDIGIYVQEIFSEEFQTTATSNSL